MDYEKEYKELNPVTTSFKPKRGIYDVFVVEEPTETEYIDGETITPQIKLLVKVNGDEPMNWFISKGETSASLYGQIIALGRYAKGLAGAGFKLIVQEVSRKDGGTRNSYTIFYERGQGHIRGKT